MLLQQKSYYYLATATTESSSSSSTTRDIVNLQPQQQQQQQHNNAEAPTPSYLCPLVVFIPFTNDDNDVDDDLTRDDGETTSQQQQQQQQKASFSLLATAMMAIDHFNQRNPSVIPELKEYDETCSITFPTPFISSYENENATTRSGGWIFDSGGYSSRSKVVNDLMDIIFQQSNNNNNNQQQQTFLPCAMIGPISPPALDGAAIIAESQQHNIPLLTYEPIKNPTTLGYLLDNHPRNFIHTLPPSTAMITALHQYLQQQQNNIIWEPRDYVRIIYDPKSSSSSEESYYSPYFYNTDDSAGEKEEDTDYPKKDFANQRLFRIVYSSTEQQQHHQQQKLSLMEALDDIKRRGYHTFVIESVADHLHDDTTSSYYSSPSSLLEDIANIADNQFGLIGNDYVWILLLDDVTNLLLSHTSSEKKNHSSSIDRLLQSAAIIDYIDPSLVEDDNNKFLEAWKNQRQDENNILQRLNDIVHPLVTSSSCYEPGYFQQELPTQYASYLYDAIINVGISACRSFNQQTDYVEEILHNNFDGASGRINFKTNSNIRDVDGIKFGFYNIRPALKADEEEKDEEEENNIRTADSYTRHLTAIYDGTDQVWTKVPNEEFIFFDGTTNQPQPALLLHNRSQDSVINTNDNDGYYISPSIQIFGLTLISLSLLFSVIIIPIWIYWNRSKRIVTASQPQFLYLLCLGSALQSTSLIFTSFDESHGWTEKQLSAACIADQWFFVLGYLVQFGAVFTKLWRLSKLLSLRRRVVTFHQVLIPFIFLIGMGIIVLLIWSIVDPLVWETDDETKDDEDENEMVQYRNCTSESGGVIIYIIPLLFLFVMSMVMSLSIVWKMKEVHKELSDAKGIFVGIVLHLILWAMGIPLYFVTEEFTADASYLFIVAMVLILANIFLFTVIGPKMAGDLCGSKGQGENSSQGENSRLSRRHTFTLGGGGTRITGLNQSSDRDFDPSSLSHSFDISSRNEAFHECQRKVISLEAEIQALKAALEEANSANNWNRNNKEDEAEPDSETARIDTEGTQSDSDMENHMSPALVDSGEREASEENYGGTDNCNGEIAPNIVTTNCEKETANSERVVGRIPTVSFRT